MPAVYIPTMLQSVSGGVKRVDIQASTMRQVVDELERLYPGMKERLVEDGVIIPSMSVSIDGEISRIGLLEKVGEDNEVHFVPAIGGGARITRCSGF